MACLPAERSATRAPGAWGHQIAAGCSRTSAEGHQARRSCQGLPATAGGSIPATCRLLPCSLASPQQGEAEPGGPALVGDPPPVVFDQRPRSDQVLGLPLLPHGFPLLAASGRHKKCRECPVAAVLRSPQSRLSRSAAPPPVRAHPQACRRCVRFGRTDAARSRSDQLPVCPWGHAQEWRARKGGPMLLAN